MTGDPRRHGARRPVGRCRLLDLTDLEARPATETKIDALCPGGAQGGGVDGDLRSGRASYTQGARALRGTRHPDRHGDQLPGRWRGLRPRPPTIPPRPCATGRTRSTSSCPIAPCCGATPPHARDMIQEAVRERLRGPRSSR